LKLKVGDGTFEDGGWRPTAFGAEGLVRLSWAMHIANSSKAFRFRG